MRHSFAKFSIAQTYFIIRPGSDSLCYNFSVSKLLDLRRNLKLLWALVLVIGMGFGAFHFVTTHPEWFFAIPTPNGRYHVLIFRESPALKQGLQSGMVGYLYLPETEALSMGPEVLRAGWVPGFFKRTFGKEIGAWEHRFYQQNFAELTAEARGLGELKVFRLEKVAEGYRIAVSCNGSSSRNWVEASLKRGDEPVYADSYQVNCSRAREALVQLDGQARPDGRVRQLQLNDEIEARIWLKAENGFLSGDEGIQVADATGPVSLISAKTEQVECYDNVEKTCSVPVVRLKARAAGTPVLLVGDMRVTLPIQVISPSVSNR